jgi:hypothetical protein
MPEQVKQALLTLLAALLAASGTCIPACRQIVAATHDGQTMTAVQEPAFGSASEPHTPATQ